MTTKTKKIISFTFVGIFVAVLAVGAGLRTNIIKLSSVTRLSAQYAANFGDDRVLVGGSHNIFVGKVIKQVGTQPLTPGGTPFTQFSAEVIENIKGKLEGDVVVNQMGGYKNGTLYIMSGETGDVLHQGDNAKYFLQPGSMYLFATRRSSITGEDGFYWLNSYPTALKLISTDETLSIEQLRELAKSDDRVQALRLSYPDEILMDADVKQNYTMNSFQSLPLAEQEKIKAEVEQMKAFQ